ncbi:hypothetical protein Gotur_004121 [Gossypium turneri]
MKVDKRLFQALAQFWNPAYSCFTFGNVDLVPTIKEFMTLLQCSKILVDKIYSKAINAPNFLKRLMNITGMSEQWVTARIKQKGDSKCILWKILKDLNLTHPDARKKVDVFALSIYGLVMMRFYWVPLIGIWGAVGYAPLLVLRQYRSRQFVPATQGLAEFEFSYRGDGYKRRVREMVSA